MKTKIGRLAPLPLLLACALSAPGWSQEVPTRVNFQGRLADNNGALVQGTKDLTFRIFNAQNGGSQLWSENQFGVALANGLFSVQLGAVAPLPPSVFASPSTFLEVAVGTETMTPRKRLAIASPYTANTALLDGQDLSRFVYLDSTTGNAGIGATAPAARLHVAATGSGAAAIFENTGSNDEVLRITASGDGSTLSLESDRLSPSLPLSLGNGQNTVFRTDVGGNLGIGTTSPNEKLHVAGNIRADAFCAGNRCKTAFLNCAETSYSVKQWPETVPNNNANRVNVYCGNNGFIVHQWSQWGTLPTSGTMLCCKY